MRRLIECLLCLLTFPGLVQGADAIDGQIRLSASTTSQIWVGGEVELYLELWSNGQSFGDQHFQTPEVPGGYLLQADASTLNLTENRGGETWLGLRYTFLLYPQRPGRLVVPSFDVRFTARAGFGSEPVPFELRTAPLEIVAQLPEGARADGLMVTTDAFSVEWTWNRELPDEGPLRLQTGDALTLEVRRRARGVPAMVFEPLPLPSIEGLGVYPAAPEVNDRVNRGELTGERIDRMTFMCETAGRFAIPDWRFQWWDRGREALEEKVIAGPTLDVARNPAFDSAAPATDQASGVVLPWRELLVGLVVLVLVTAFGRRFGRPVAAWVRRQWAAYLRRRRQGLLQPLNPRS